jgi:hypothetical protein
MLRLSLIIFPILIGAIFFTEEASSQKQSFPRFEDYPVLEKFKGRPAPVNLRSHPDARLFRTRLREAAKNKPNFAGHYILVTWGCGASCNTVALIDARTGKVYFAPFEVTASSDFRLDSRLFVLNPSMIDAWLSGGKYFDIYDPSWWVWKNNRFVKIYPKSAQHNNGMHPTANSGAFMRETPCLIC